MRCERAIVADSEIGNVISCSCGIVQVSCFCASVRMPSEAFLTFAVMIDQAVSNIAAKQLEPVEREESTSLGEEPVEE
jgi:hypothetical protein